MISLLLNENWDISLAENGTLSTVDGAYDRAQKVANEVRLFTQDAYFNQLSGIPHFSLELGNLPPESVLASRIKEAAQKVSGVQSAAVTFTSFNNRELQGNINIKLISGETFNVNI